MLLSSSKRCELRAPERAPDSPLQANFEVVAGYFDWPPGVSHYHPLVPRIAQRRTPRPQNIRVGSLVNVASCGLDVATRTRLARAYFDFFYLWFL